MGRGSSKTGQHLAANRPGSARIGPRSTSVGPKSATFRPEQPGQICAPGPKSADASACQTHEGPRFAFQVRAIAQRRQVGPESRQRQRGGERTSPAHVPAVSTMANYPSLFGGVPGEGNGSLLTTRPILDDSGQLWPTWSILAGFGPLRQIPGEIRPNLADVGPKSGRFRPIWDEARRALAGVWPKSGCASAKFSPNRPEIDRSRADIGFTWARKVGPNLGDSWPQLAEFVGAGQIGRSVGICMVFLPEPYLTYMPAPRMK